MQVSIPCMTEAHDPQVELIFHSIPKVKIMAPPTACLSPIGEELLQTGLQERVDFINSEVKFIEDSLADIKGLKVLHSNASYILMDGTDAGKKGDDMIEFALKKGMILRPQNVMYGRDGYFRITLGSKEENRMAVAAVREFFGS